MSTRYSYFALVTPMYPSADDPSIVCRQWTDEDGRTHEEKYTENLKWEKSYVSYYVQSGKQDGEINAITEAAAMRFVEQTQPARVHGLQPADGQYFYSVIVTGLHPLEHPRALLRTWRSPQGYSMEQEWTPTGGWVNSSYMDDLDHGHLDGEAVGIAEEDVQRYQEIARR